MHIIKIENKKNKKGRSFFIAMEQELILEVLQQQLDEIRNGFELIVNHFINIEAGLRLLMYVAVAFFVWVVIKQLYKLFGGVFLGGV